MVASDEKLDLLVETMHKIDKDLEILKVRTDSIDKTLQTRATALRNIYDFMHNTDQRLLKIETMREDNAVVKSHFAPYILAVFSSIVSYIVYHWVGS